MNVIEVNRTNRQTRRRKGKTDTVDAEAAARAVLRGDATVIPKAATDRSNRSDSYGSPGPAR